MGFLIYKKRQKIGWNWSGIEAKERRILETGEFFFFLCEKTKEKELKGERGYQVVQTEWRELGDK